MSSASGNMNLAALPWRGAAAALLMWGLYAGIHWIADRLGRRRPNGWMAATLGAIVASVLLLSLTVLALARAGLAAADLATAVALFVALHLLKLARHVRHAWGESDARSHHLSSAHSR